MNIETLRQQAIKVDLDAGPAPQKIYQAMSRLGDGWNAACHPGAVDPRVCFPPHGQRTAQLARRFRIAVRIPVAHRVHVGRMPKTIRCSA